MNHLSSPVTPARHARLFEYLRQQGRARIVAERLDRPACPPADGFDDIRRRACASLCGVGQGDRRDVMRPGRTSRRKAQPVAI